MFPDQNIRKRVKDLKPGESMWVYSDDLHINPETKKGFIFKKTSEKMDGSCYLRRGEDGKLYVSILEGTSLYVMDEEDWTAHFSEVEIVNFVCTYM